MPLFTGRKNDTHRHELQRSLGESTAAIMVKPVSAINLKISVGVWLPGCLTARSCIGP